MTGKEKAATVEPFLMCAHQAAMALSIGRSTWWEWVRDGRVRKGTAIGARKTVWSAQYIREVAEDILQKGIPEKGVFQ
jgi:predicted DNA-binding transcriptional regulator AlpA